MAAAGACVRRASFSVGPTTARSVALTPSELMSRAILSDSSGSSWSRLSSTRAAYQRRITSCREAARHTASSEMQDPTMLTPMSVGDLYGDSPRIRSNRRFSTGKISTSRL